MIITPLGTSDQIRFTTDDGRDATNCQTTKNDLTAEQSTQIRTGINCQGYA